MNIFVKTALLALAASSSSHAIAKADEGADRRPNIVVIVADDLGLSDLGAFGGEIRTPALDSIAEAGVRLTNFHSAPACSPTRSMLLSGTDNHTAGVGAMAETRTMRGGAQTPGWGYEGVITTRVATLAERLRAGGYHTIMSGKWHLGLTAEQNPAARGFASSFAILQGGNNHFGGGFGPDSNPNLRATYTENGREVGIPEEFYSSDYFTTKLIEQLDGRPKSAPFFAYLAFTAPHSPLQAPAEDIARYKGRYDQGWAVLREERLARMKALGIVPASIKAADIAGYREAWEKLTPEEKRVEARKMEIYAAMVDRLDQNVGRVVTYLKNTGTYENTIILFSSDNGPAAEGAELYGLLPGMAEHIASQDQSFEAMGTKSSLLFYGPNWAQAASAPYRLHKGVITEGGTRVAAFIKVPGAAREREISDAYASVMDVTPTLLDAAGLTAEPVFEGREVAPIRGRSMLPYLQQATRQVHADDEPIAFELHGHRSVRQGRWKLVYLTPPHGTSAWALYDLATDPAEQHDLSAAQPERTRVLLAAWDEFARQTHIAP